MKTGVYVGSFDPVHKGHMKMVKQLLNRNIVNQVVMVATTDYWDKKLSASLSDRLAMLSVYQSKRIIIDNEHNHLQYTYQVLSSLKEKHSAWDLYLIIGDDLLVSFDKWQNLDELLQFKVIIIDRMALDVNAYLKLLPKAEQFIKAKHFDKLAISSSQIRAMINMNREDELKKYLDPGVLNYIKDNRLYHNDQ